MKVQLFVFHILLINVSNAEECTIFAESNARQTFKSLDSVTSRQAHLRLYIYSCDLGQFTTDTFKNLTNLETIVLNWCTIDTVQPGSFQELKNLKYLGLSSVNLKHTEATAFKELISLEEIGLHDTELRSVNEEIFEGFNNLRKLRMSNATRRITPHSFVTLQNLRSLILIDNKIQHIKKDVFPATITTLFLEKNRIRHLGDSVFEKLTSLEELDLSFNFLSRLGRNNFWNLKKLRKLNLDNNRLVDVTWTELNNLESLEFFDISSNQLYYLPLQFLKTSDKLKYIYISYNHLTLFDFGYFHYTHDHLLQVRLNHNEWKCENLDTLRHVIKKGVQLLDNSTRTEPNVNGVACDDNQVEGSYHLFEESRRYEIHY